MTIKILKQGIKPEDHRYEAKCMRCSTEFEFLRSDAEYRSDDARGEDTVRVRCPYCRHNVYVLANKYVRNYSTGGTEDRR